MRTEREGLFLPPLTFARLPYSQDFSSADAAILGLPFDCGSHPTRLGARLGPNAIREQSVLTLELLEDAEGEPLSSMTVIDAGDLNFPGGGLAVIHDFYSRTETAIGQIIAAGCTPVTLGGDGAVTLPQLRAAARVYPDLTVIHFDAHTDTYPLKSNDHFDNATPFTHAVHEGLVRAEASIHVGTRAPVNAEETIRFTSELGYRVLPWAKIEGLPTQDISQMIRDGLDNAPIYLCFDMDFFDPAAAPGVATPTPGGPMAFQGLHILKSLSGLNIIACDINTVSPPYDVNGITSQLAATVIMECLELIRARP